MLILSKLLTTVSIHQIGLGLKGQGHIYLKIESEYDQEITQQSCGTVRKSHTTIKRHQEDKQSKAKQQALSPNQDDGNTRMNTK